MFDLLKLDQSSTYAVMAEEIKSNLPMIREASSHFGKHQSQFMDNFLTVSHPTPMRNARQCLAELNKSISALREAQYKLSKKKIYIKRLERDLAMVKDELLAEEIQLKIDFKTSELHSTMLYVEGAIRAVKNYTDQYKQILKNAGYTEMSEEAFESEEEQYHIMKSFDQALCAARSRGGLIDEGNHIYFAQIGVNGGAAQKFVSNFLIQEQEELEVCGVLTDNFRINFLKEMGRVFKGCSKIAAENKGMMPSNDSALIKRESWKDLRRNV